DILHSEAQVRLHLHNHLEPAGYIIPCAARLGMLATMDFEVVRIALNQPGVLLTPLAINISADALCSTNFREQVIAALQAEPDKARRLWLDFSEPCALRHPAEFRSLSHALLILGCQVGLEHVGPEFTRIAGLED